MIEGYIQLAPGHWFQKEKTGPLPNYGMEYSKNSYDVYDGTDRMSELRYEIICGSVGNFDTVCDFGYGNGSFLKYCKTLGKKAYGYDISDYPLPRGIHKVDDPDNCVVDVMTFFDSIEHLDQENLVQFLKKKQVKHICISVPWFHENLGAQWFLNWKHRRENEHFHHFDAHGLTGMVTQAGYKIVHVSNHEDLIRKPVDIHPNILTVVATKIQ